MQRLKDRSVFHLNGITALILIIVLITVSIGSTRQLLDALEYGDPVGAGLASLIAAPAIVFFLLGRFFTQQPNEASIILFFGSYVGTVKTSGLRWTLPLTGRRKISMRYVNHTTPLLKVNDANGNPIEIAAVIVWRVSDAARALLGVENYTHFVHTQAEAALRALANRFPYEAVSDTEQTSLRGSPETLGDILRAELQERLEVAGVDISEARLSRVAYASEIASVMLRRQQAMAVVAARRIITENAVAIATEATKALHDQGLIDASPEARTRLVSNLLVALVAEHDTQPVLDVSS